MKFEAEGREFEKCLRSLEQFIQTVKSLKNFVNTMRFLVVSGGFSYVKIRTIIIHIGKKYWI